MDHYSSEGQTGHSGLNGLLLLYIFIETHLIWLESMLDVEGQCASYLSPTPPQKYKHHLELFSSPRNVLLL